MEINLQEKTAFVCGSTQGIGKATAIELANLGAEIVLIARNEEKLQKTLIELDASRGQNHQYLVADFSQPELLKQTLESYLSKLEKPKAHILINNTGGPKGGEIFKASTEDFEKAYQMHLICNHILVQTLVPWMREVNYGRIINIISTSVKEPIDGLGVSNTTRWAVASWAKTLSKELGKWRITVNNVLPGFIETSRLEEIVQNQSQKLGVSPQQVRQNMVASVPVGRIAQPQELAQAVAFLASPAAAYITGINLPVDGGRTRSL